MSDLIKCQSPITSVVTAVNWRHAFEYILYVLEPGRPWKFLAGNMSLSWCCCAIKWWQNNWSYNLYSRQTLCFNYLRRLLIFTLGLLSGLQVQCLLISRVCGIEHTYSFWTVCGERELWENNKLMLPNAAVLLGHLVLSPFKWQAQTSVRWHSYFLMTQPQSWGNTTVTCCVSALRGQTSKLHLQQFKIKNEF